MRRVAKYQYTNTNYLLLSLIGDAITGDHAAYMREHIFKPLGMQQYVIMELITIISMAYYFRKDIGML